MNRENTQSGFALAAAVFALVILSVLATGGFYLARQESRIGMASERARMAFHSAELGATQVMSNWDRQTFGALNFWETATVSQDQGDASWSVDVTRMSDRLYFLLATGGVTLGEENLGAASRLVGVVAKSYSLAVDPPAAFTARDQVRFVGKATVKGIDGHPPGWTGVCPGPLKNKAGMLSDDLSKVDYKAKNFDVTGEPPLLEDAPLVDEVFELFGDLEWEEITSMATMTVVPQNFNNIGPSVANGSCDYSNRQNWGDPLNPGSPCGNYFPLIHIKGNGTSKINGGGVGQGILLVDGDIWAGGNFTFFGLVIVKGMFETGGSDNRVFGAVMAANAELDEQSLTGGSLVQYSSCALNRAVDMNPDLTWVRPIERRGWVDLSSVVSDQVGNW